MQLDAIWLPESQQQIFRELMDAMARPGLVKDIRSWVNGNSGYQAILATLLDAEVSLADHHSLLEEADWPLLQSQRTSAEKADYLLCNGQRAPDFEPCLGTLESPDRSATLVLVVGDLYHGESDLSILANAAKEHLLIKLTGPGIEGEKRLLIEGLTPEWMTKRAEWNLAFPLGVDFILAGSEKISAIPRTTQVQLIDGADQWAM